VAGRHSSDCCCTPTDLNLEAELLSLQIARGPCSQQHHGQDASKVHHSKLAAVTIELQPLWSAVQHKLALEAQCGQAEGMDHATAASHKEQVLLSANCTDGVCSAAEVCQLELVWCLIQQDSRRLSMLRKFMNWASNGNAATMPKRHSLDVVTRLQMVSDAAGPVNMP